MTLKKVRVYCCMALAILLFCACQEKEYIELSDGEVPVEVVLSSRADGNTSAITASTVNTGENGIGTIRIMVFRYYSLQFPGITQGACEYNESITNNGSASGGWTPVGEDNPLSFQNGAFVLGSPITTGRKKIVVIANEASYFQSDVFKNIKSYTELVTLQNNTATVASALPNVTAIPNLLLMTDCINTEITTPSFTPDAATPISIAGLELVRACAKVDASITATSDLIDSAKDWKVTSVKLTNCTNKVAWTGSVLSANSYFMDDSSKKEYTVTLGADVAFDDTGNKDLFSNSQYVYENIIAPVTELSAMADNATKLTVTLQKGASPATKNLTIYIGNGELLENTAAPAKDVFTYNVYRNYHYQLSIQAKKSTTTTVSTSIMPKSIHSNDSSSDDIQFAVTVTCTEE